MFNPSLFRWYQLAAIQSIFDYFDAFHSPDAHPAVAMPTATGKSWVIAGFIQRVFEIYDKSRVLMVTDDSVLIEQNLEKLLLLWPSAPVGVHSADLNRYDVILPIVFGGIQSMFRKAALFGRVDILIIDEAHMVSPKNLTMYRKLITQLKIINPGLRVIGFSATCFRMGQGLLIEGDDRLFTDICYDLTNVEMYNRLVAEGWLSPLIPQRANHRLSAEGIKINRFGEYDEKAQQAALNKREITTNVVAEMLEAAANRKRWLIFTTGVDHANDVAQMLRYRGIDAVPIHSKLPAKQWDANYFQFKTGQVQAAVAMNSMTKGVDVPEIDYIAFLRFTNSAGFWVQALGRGARIAPWVKKTNCLVSDFTTNTRRLGPINDPVIPRPKLKKKHRSGAAPVKICGNPQCRCYVHASLAVCNFCGYEFPSSIKFSPDVDGLEVQAGVIEEPKVEEWKIDTITYHHFARRGQTSPPTLLVSYISGFRRAQEYVCFEHGGNYAGRAKNWWRERTSPGTQMPLTVADALALSTQHIIPPAIVRVWVNSKPKPNKIVGYIWQ